MYVVVYRYVVCILETKYHIYRGMLAFQRILKSNAIWTPNTPRMVAKATAADLQCCAHSAAVLFVTQTQIMECTYVIACNSRSTAAP